MAKAIVPNIVATQSFIDRTTALGTTTVFTPSIAGLYRVSIYASAQGGSTVNVTVGWTDDYISPTFVQSAAHAGASFLIKSAASDTFSTYIIVESMD